MAELTRTLVFGRNQYEKQKRVLVWPTELEQDFRDIVDDLRPIEEKVKFPTEAGEELRTEFREEYRDYVKEELPKLAAIIGSSHCRLDWGILPFICAIALGGPPFSFQVR